MSKAPRSGPDFLGLVLMSFVFSSWLSNFGPGFSLTEPGFTIVSAAFAKNKKDKGTVEPSIMHFKEGEKYLKEKDYERAADAFLQAAYFARNSYNPKAWYKVGICRKQLKEWPKAIEAFQGHLDQKDFDSPDGWIDLAECYIEIGEIDKARAAIEKGRNEADYQNKRPIYAMGKLYEKLGDPSMAINFYIDALDQKPWTYGEAWMGLARCQLKVNEPEAAARNYREMLDSLTVKGLDLNEVHYNYGSSLSLRGNHQGAIDNWHYAIKLDPKCFNCYVALASLFDEEKHLSSAIKAYENAIRLAPKGANTKALETRMQFLQTQLQGDQGRREIKPTPYMRQEMDRQEQSRRAMDPPAAKDSGF